MTKSGYSSNNGFTLIELLIVMLIISVLSVAGVQLIGTGSYQNKLKKQGSNFSKQLNYMCEKAVFENRPFALEFNQHSHQLITYRKQSWITLSPEKWPYQAMDQDLEWKINVRGKPQPLSTDFVQKPHVICGTTGQLTSFELMLLPKTGTHSAYKISSLHPTQLALEWVDEG